MKNSDSFKFYLSFTIPIIIILIIMLYKNLFSTINNEVILKPLETVQNVNIKSCGELKNKEQYNINDYYISASYMTPCIQNNLYGYLSTDMIRKVIQNGARIIQIPICQENMSNNSYAICATCEPETMLITSMNSLELLDVWHTILGCAFKNSITNDRISNPLFIELIINTKNTFTLDHL